MVVFISTLHFCK